MINFILNPFRILLVLVWTAICAILCLLLLLFSRNSDLVLKVITRSLWAPVTLFLTGVKLEVHGRENIPTDQYAIYVSNHASHMDIPATVMAITVPLYFMLKQELKKVPFLGWYSTAMGMIYVDRKNKAKAQESIKAAGELIKEGKNVLVYPEGSRSPDGEIKLFRKGAFAISKASGIGIVPFHIDGSHDILPKGSFLFKPGKIVVRIGQLVSFEDDVSEIEMASDLQERVKRLKSD